PPRLAPGEAGKVASGPRPHQQGAAPEGAGRLDGPVDGWRRHLVGPLRLPGEQPARADQPCRRPGSLCRQGIGEGTPPQRRLRLQDGRLLMTYGHRRKPIGNQARISADHGRTWSEPLILSDDASSWDLGYPSTVQLKDGSLVTVWYEVLKGAKQAVLRQAKWH